MTANNEQSGFVQVEDDPNASNPRNDYYFRLLLTLSAVGTLAVVDAWRSFGISHVFMLILLAYPHALYWTVIRYFEDRQQDIFHASVYVDAVLMGMLIGFIDFNLLAAFVFVAWISSLALMNYGVRYWLQSIAAIVFGFLLTLLFHKPMWLLQGELAMSMPAMIGAVIYSGLISYFTNKRITDLKNRLMKSATEHQDLRMKMWKLSRYVSPQIWRTIFSGREVKLETNRKRLTVFFSDITGFTELSEKMEAEDMTDMLNHYLNEMSQIIHKYGGTIDKFIGDAIMVFFGDPTTRGAQADCLACVSMAIEMKKHMRIMRQHWLGQGIETPLEIRMGINTGYCTVGNFGTDQRLDYTVLGTEVNLASRLETAAPPGEILISHETYSLIRDVILCDDKGTVSLKGFSQPIRVYSVVDFRKNVGDKQAYFEQRADGFSMFLDLDKVKNYDKDRVLKALLTAAQRLKNKVID
ncbi:MAG TPA: adenylate/guanylate cyclase domain-containing protein [Pseudomonadales bacterium]|nr:adenylate/guanylate cyclase domain-containing protein [Pseudomonadales bacterium]